MIIYQESIEELKEKKNKKEDFLKEIVGELLEEMLSHYLFGKRNKFMKKIEKIKTVLNSVNKKEVILLFILFLIWLMPLHESLHLLGCSLAGLKGNILSLTRVDCPRIMNPEISDFSRTIYFGAPYIFDIFVIVMLFAFKKTIKEKCKVCLFAIGYTVTIDIGVNLIGTFFTTTDFSKLVYAGGIAGKVLFVVCFTLIFSLSWWFISKLRNTYKQK